MFDKLPPSERLTFENRTVPIERLHHNAH
ncbi:protein of unknown function [Rhodovastum atsumiense]|nr:protein of unknown function [Rhodovastum atsumiense]